MPRSSAKSRCRCIFVTGTDTGVGKTIVTALLLAHLRAHGAKALAIKPFCSGGRADPALLRAVMEAELSLEQINPFSFVEPVAPLVASRKHHRQIPFQSVLAHADKMKRRCEWLLVEGAGGLLVPLGEGYDVLTLIQRLNAAVIVVARNRLGTLNHTLLTVQALRAAKIRHIKVALTDARAADASALSNEKILSELLGRTSLYRIPFLGPRASRTSVIREAAVSLGPVLSGLLG